MRVAAAAVLLGMVWQSATRVGPEARHFRFAREVRVPAGANGAVCATLDARMYEHSPTLGDVRLLAGGREVPYALMTSQTEAQDATAKVVNLAGRGGRISFDLQMPGGMTYSTVKLELAGQNFVGTAKVTGGGRSLGEFTVFDLSGRGLGRSTALAMGETSLPLLHVEMAMVAAPGHPGFVATPAMVLGAEIPPSREAQTIYTTVAETSAIVQEGSRSVAVFAVPAHVPVERVRFEMVDEANFSRAVTVRAQAGAAAPVEQIEGEISRVRLTLAGREIHEESLGVEAVLGSNAREAARVEVAVENGAEKPPAIRAEKLEMRERRICFAAPAGPVTMYYGDEAMPRPVDAFGWAAGTAYAGAQLGPEQANPGFVSRAGPQTLRRRAPGVFWMAAVFALAALGGVGVRVGRRRPGPTLRGR